MGDKDGTLLQARVAGDVLVQGIERPCWVSSAEIAATNYLTVGNSLHHSPWEEWMIDPFLLCSRRQLQRIVLELMAMLQRSWKPCCAWLHG